MGLMDSQGSLPSVQDPDPRTATMLFARIGVAKRHIERLQ
jgi:hypothetical protein